MEFELIKKFGWTVLLRGVAGILFGLLALIWPGATLTVLVFIFAIYLLFDGILNIVVGIISAGKHRPWGVFLFEGVASVLLGIFALIWPDWMALILVWIVAVWAVVTGILELTIGIIAPWEGSARWFLAGAGILSIILGVLMFIFPSPSLLVFVWIIGGYALFFGLILLIGGIKLLGLEKESQVEEK